MTKVRIVFTSEIYIEGDAMSDVTKKWEQMPLFSDEANECYACQQSILAVEDADTNKDLLTEFNNA